jgi:mRNA degradation ribonuclease J1/J2
VQKLIAGMFNESPTDELRDPDLLQEKMRALLKRYFRKSMGARPMILPVIWEM